LCASRFNLGNQVAWNISRGCTLAQEGFHRDKVNHPFKIRALADRNLHWHDSATKDLAQVVNHALELCVLAVHLVDEDDAGQVALIQIVPTQFGANFNSRHRVNQHDACIRNRNGAFDLTNKVNEPWGVQDVDLVAFVLTGHHCSPDGDTATNRFVIPVGHGSAVFNAATATGGARVVKHRFCQSRFARTRMPDQRYVAQLRSCETSHYPSSAGCADMMLR